MQAFAKFQSSGNKTYYVLLVEGMTGPVKNKEFRKVVHHLADDPKGVEGTLIQYLGKLW